MPSVDNMLVLQSLLFMECISIMLLFFLSLPSVSIRAEPEKINGSEEGGVDDEDVSDIIEQPIEDTDFL